MRVLLAELEKNVQLDTKVSALPVIRRPLGHASAPKAFPLRLPLLSCTPYNESSPPTKTVRLRLKSQRFPSSTNIHQNPPTSTKINRHPSKSTEIHQRPPKSTKILEIGAWARATCIQPSNLPAPLPPMPPAPNSVPLGSKRGTRNGPAECAERLTKSTQGLVPHRRVRQATTEWRS